MLLIVLSFCGFGVEIRNADGRETFIYPAEVVLLAFEACTGYYDILLE